VRNYLVTLNNWALLPNSTIYRGNKKFDFYADETAVPQIIKEKLVELKEDATVIFKKAGETTKLSADLKKEGKPISVNEDKIKGGKK
jgi:hypothetical protein